METHTTTRPEVAHDEALLALYTVRHRATVQQATAARNLIASASSVEGSGVEFAGATWNRRRSTYVAPARGLARDGDPVEATVADAMPAIESMLAGTAEPAPRHSISSVKPETARRVLDAHTGAIKASAEATAAIYEHEENYTGWTRFFLVTSSAGHVHSSMNCTSCKATTTFAPVPSLSGLDESAAVEVLGETLCTVCFPSAPVKPSKVTAAQASKLIEEGEEAFLAARAKARR